MTCISLAADEEKALERRSNAFFSFKIFSDKIRRNHLTP